MKFLLFVVLFALLAVFAAADPDPKALSIFPCDEKRQGSVRFFKYVGYLSLFRSNVQERGSGEERVELKALVALTCHGKVSVINRKDNKPQDLAVVELDMMDVKTVYQIPDSKEGKTATKDVAGFNLPFYFTVSSNGALLHVYHHKKEDPFTENLKKGIVSTIQTKLSGDARTENDVVGLVRSQYRQGYGKCRDEKKCNVRPFFVEKSFGSGDILQPADANLSANRHQFNVTITCEILVGNDEKLRGMRQCIRVEKSDIGAGDAHKRAAEKAEAKALGAEFPKDGAGESLFANSDSKVALSAIRKGSADYKKAQELYNADDNNTIKVRIEKAEKAGSNDVDQAFEAVALFHESTESTESAVATTLDIHDDFDPEVASVLSFEGENADDMVTGTAVLSAESIQTIKVRAAENYVKNTNFPALLKTMRADAHKSEKGILSNHFGTALRYCHNARAAAMPAIEQAFDEVAAAIKRKPVKGDVEFAHALQSLAVATDSPAAEKFLFVKSLSLKIDTLLAHAIRRAGDFAHPSAALLGLLHDIYLGNARGKQFFAAVKVSPSSDEGRTARFNAYLSLAALAPRARGKESIAIIHDIISNLAASVERLKKNPKDKSAISLHLGAAGNAGDLFPLTVLRIIAVAKHPRTNRGLPEEVRMAAVRALSQRALDGKDGRVLTLLYRLVVDPSVPVNVRVAAVDTLQQRENHPHHKAQTAATVELLGTMLVKQHKILPSDMKDAIVKYLLNNGSKAAVAFHKKYVSLAKTLGNTLATDNEDAEAQSLAVEHENLINSEFENFDEEADVLIFGFLRRAANWVNDRIIKPVVNAIPGVGDLSRKIDDLKNKVRDSLGLSPASWASGPTCINGGTVGQLCIYETDMVAFAQSFGDLSKLKSQGFVYEKLVGLQKLNLYAGIFAFAGYRASCAESIFDVVIAARGNVRINAFSKKFDILVAQFEFAVRPDNGKTSYRDRVLIQLVGKSFVDRGFIPAAVKEKASGDEQEIELWRKDFPTIAKAAAVINAAIVSFVFELNIGLSIGVNLVYKINPAYLYAEIGIRPWVQPSITGGASISLLGIASGGPEITASTRIGITPAVFTTGCKACAKVTFDLVPPLKIDIKLKGSYLWGLGKFEFNVYSYQMEPLSYKLAEKCFFDAALVFNPQKKPVQNLPAPAPAPKPVPAPAPAPVPKPAPKPVPAPAPRPASQINQDQTMNQGQLIMSPNGVYKFIMQADGNLVLYSVAGRNGRNTDYPLWSSNSYGRGVAPRRLVMQGDGNLVIYDGRNRPQWASNTWRRGTPAYRLVVQDDGNVVIYGSRGATWATNTHGRR